MPAFYAHKRFGAQIAGKIPESLESIIRTNYTASFITVHFISIKS